MWNGDVFPEQDLGATIFSPTEEHQATLVAWVLRQVLLDFRMPGSSVPGSAGDGQVLRRGGSGTTGSVGSRSAQLRT